MTFKPAWVVVAEKTRETVTGTVSSKVEKKFGYTCDSCEWIHLKDEHLPVYEDEFNSQENLEAEGYTKYISKRCARHQSAMKKWQRAKNTFVHLDELRMNEEIDCLRFTTFTRKEWNIIVSIDNMFEEQEIHKKKCIRSFRNWRNRNKWWQSREALGQMWPECVITPIWNGYGIEEVKLHFHIHAILVSKYLDNKPQLEWGVTQDGTAVFKDDSKFTKEWGGIVDVRAVRDYQVKYVHKGEERRGCGRKACMRYLVKYITKAAHWKSIKIGRW